MSNKTNLPEFDPIAIRVQHNMYPFNQQDFIEGARWQHQQDAKVIAAKDAEIAELRGCSRGRKACDAIIDNLELDKSQLSKKIRELEIDRQAFKNCQDQLNFSRHRIETLELAKEQLLEKIRELEQSGSRKHLVEKTNKLQAANSLIDELENALELCHRRMKYTAWTDEDCFFKAEEALKKIKQWKEGGK